MNIKVIKTSGPFEHLFSSQTGGETASLNLTIEVDESLLPEMQRELIIHAVIETYCRSWTHDKVEQLTEYIQTGLEQLGVGG